MASEVVLHELTGADWRELRALRLRALQSEPGVFFSPYATEAERDEAAWRALASGDAAHQVFGLFDAGRLVGISGVFRDRDDPSGRTAVLGMSYIEPEYRGTGLVTRLYAARIAWARAKPEFERAIVGHRRSNEPSRRAILRSGFTWTGNRPHRWPDGSDEEYVAYEMILRADRSKGS
jgi:RimJ/RimL family protein N-acetyltransferase